MPNPLEKRIQELEQQLASQNTVVLQNPQLPPISVGQRDYSDYGSFKLDRKNGILEDVLEVTDNYTVRSNDRYILVNQASGTKTITLPQSTFEVGKKITIKALTAAQVDIASADNIDGSASVSLTLQYEWDTIVYDGTTWHQV